MTKNEIKWLDIIREDSQPDEALVIALNVIFEYLEQFESFEVSSLAYLQEQA